VSEGEVQKISGFLGVRAKDFVRDYARRVGNRFCLKELSISGSLHCVFFDDPAKHCSIYPVRPGQCRAFPFWEHFKKNPEEALTECPGVFLIRGKDKLQRF
jgi:Fe-S-cluster containining protein